MKKTLFVAAVLVAFYSAQASAVCPIQAAKAAASKAASAAYMHDALALNKGYSVRTTNTSAAK